VVTANDNESHRDQDLARQDVLASLTRLIADRAAHSSVHKTKICLFLGAGADISSGGISFSDLKRQALEEFSKRHVFDVTTDERIETGFEALFSALEPDERALLLESLFRRMQPLNPSDAYKLIVLLAEAGGIDAVVTTNFDVMLEHAQHQLGRDLFQVFAPGFARPYLLSHDRFELPRKPYLKLHGDIASRSVVLLTSAELEGSTYDPSMLDLFGSILKTHDLVLAGYGGYDTALARIIAAVCTENNNRIFWCNPHPPSTKSPLYSLIAERVRIIPIKFDDLMTEVARPILERPSSAPIEPAYLRCLFDWRVDYCNREYIHAYGERSGKSIVDLFARRRTIEQRLTSFLMPNRPLAIITGPSGFGKTIIGIRLHKLWKKDETTRIMLLRARAFPASGDIEQFISEQLGGLGSHATFSLFRLEKWLRECGLRLVLFVDGVNEFSPDLARCVQLLRNILRFCYFLPETESTIRVIVTVRQETWNSMLPHLDLVQLQKTIWLEEDRAVTVSTLSCGELTDEELNDALARLRDHGYKSINIRKLSPTMANQLRDPYLLNAFAEGAEAGLGPTLGAAVYQQAFEAKLKRRVSFIDTATLKEVVSSVALQCMESQRDRFREIDIHPVALRGEVVRLMKDFHIFVDAGEGLLQFDHDRTFEYFLALGLASGSGPRLETLDDLAAFLHRFKTQSKPLAAARLYFQLAPDERFSVISKSLQLLDSHTSRYGSADREALYGFAREVLVEMSDQGIALAEQYLTDAIDAARAGNIGPYQLRAVVQACASLRSERAIPLLAKVAHAPSSLATTEADIYATDKLVKKYLLDRCPQVDLLRDEPYSTFFADGSVSAWERFGRFLGFAAQLGPDNTHSVEYRSTYAVLGTAFDHLLTERPWSKKDVKSFTSYFLDNCDRLLFNATEHGINRFFGNSNRLIFEPVLKKLAAGSVLGNNDLLSLEPYTQSLAFDIEYHLTHVMFIISSLNDVEKTLQLAEQRFTTFSNDTPPEEIDFFHAVLVYLHILHKLPYDNGRFSSWEDKILRDWPDVLLYRPGMERGERRGFQDIFDRVFEDGFGVVYPYGVLLPAIRRQQERYEDYRRDIAAETSTQLPMYTKYLREFLGSGRIEEALQLLQALGGVIVVWPTEGLLALRDVIGYPEPRIRRATLRILAEAFNRHPGETLQFLNTSGAAVTDDDMVEIKIRHDARIGRRQIEAEEWARMGHFLIRQPHARDVLISCAEILLRATSFQAAAEAILDILGFTTAQADKIRHQ
jgi:hypothetical protein